MGLRVTTDSFLNLGSKCRSGLARSRRLQQIAGQHFFPMPPSSSTSPDALPTTEPLFVPPLGATELGKSDESKKRRGPVSCAGACATQSWLASAQETE